LTDKSFSLIPQPLLPQEEKGSKKKLKIFKSPSPSLGEGFGVRAFEFCQSMRFRWFYSNSNDAQPSASVPQFLQQAGDVF
jgi:hypothetical protein